MLIADDHAVVRQGLNRILADAGEPYVAGEAASGREVLQKIRAEAWDVAVLDINMPGTPSGIELIKRVKLERPRLPALVLSMYNEDQFAVRALRAGASGYLTKESAPDQLVTAIRKVAGGGKFVSARVAEMLANELDPFGGPAAGEALSDREHQVLRLIVSGKSLSDIALTLSLSVKTVSTHKSRLMQKLGVKNNVELIRYTLKNGLAA
jgi:DNA-binding NarL/FixJ family response regulator